MRVGPVMLSCALVALSFAACDRSDAPPGDAATLFAETDEATVGGTNWTWHPLPGMQCRDGSGTGFGLRRAPADAPPEARNKLLLFLDGGGACYAPERCINSDAGFDAARFADEIEAHGATGLFADRPDNPFQNWNAVFVPYCTGDVHSGDTTDVLIPGAEALGPQQFVGRRNLRALLDRIRGEARHAEQVALVGPTGAGFGTIGTYGLVAERLAPAPVTLIDDAGPIPPDDDVITDSLQLLWRTVWNLGAAAPDGCGERCFQPSGDGLEHLLAYYAGTYPERGFALISYTNDVPNRFNFGYLNPGCVVAANGACLVPTDRFRDGLLTIRSELAAFPNAVTYYTEGRGHMSVRSDDFYARSTAGVPLNEWVGDVLAGTAEDVGPAPRD